MPLPINVMLPAPFIGGILTITWPYTRGTAVLVTIAVTSGASSSATMALVSAPMSDVGRSLWSQSLHLLARRYLAQLTTPQVGTLGSSSRCRVASMRLGITVPLLPSFSLRSRSDDRGVAARPFPGRADGEAMHR